MNAKDIKLLATCLLLAACSMAAKAQTIDDGFIIDAPDSVAAGDTVTVRYTIETQQLQSYMSPLFNGFEFIDMNHEIQNRGRKTIYTFIYRIVPINAGSLLIGPMTVMRQGEEIVSKSKRLSVRPDKGHEYAVSGLRQLFLENGMDPDTCEICFVHESPELTIASSVRSGYFAVLANEEFAKGLDNPVLAYGFEGGIWSAQPELLNMMDYYIYQLIHIKENSIKPDGQSIKPLLGDIAWGQNAPFNSECPTVVSNGDTLHALAGCGPVAFGQIMKHYELDGSKEPSRLLAEIGAAMGTQYGLKVSTTYSNNYRKSLVDQFGFSPRFRLVSLPQDELFALTYHELEHGRPVVIMNERHSFICDGHRNGYLHFNLGWNGKCNGYYRIFNAPVSERKDMLYSMMAIGLMPDRYKDASKSVTLNKKTRLKDVLTTDEMENLHSLEIKGKLAGEDIRLLRRMAGAVDDKNYMSWLGSLQHLDLSKATFTNDNADPYMSTDAEAMKFKVWKQISYMYGNQHRVERKEYDFTFMTEDQWQEIQKYNMDRGYGFRIVRNGNRYTVEYLLESRKVGRSMFAGCVNLKRIILPKNILEVSHDAFENTEASVIRQ